MVEIKISRQNPQCKCWANHFWNITFSQSEIAPLDTKVMTISGTSSDLNEVGQLRNFDRALKNSFWCPNQVSALIRFYYCRWWGVSSVGFKPPVWEIQFIFFHFTCIICASWNDYSIYSTFACLGTKLPPFGNISDKTSARRLMQKNHLTLLANNLMHQYFTEFGDAVFKPSFVWTATWWHIQLKD